MALVEHDEPIEGIATAPVDDLLETALELASALALGNEGIVGGEQDALAELELAILLILEEVALVLGVLVQAEVGEVCAVESGLITRRREKLSEMARSIYHIIVIAQRRTAK